LLEINNKQTVCEKRETKQAATFILQIKFRQNNTWQGSLEWVEKKKTMMFRSALELIKIIDSTKDQGYQVEVFDIGNGQQVIGK